MPLISFKDLGRRGIITDLAPAEIPLDAWSSGKNVRFSTKGVERVLGNQTVYGTPAIEPLAAYRTAVSGNIAWSYWGAANAYSTDGVTQYDITRATGGNYSATARYKWTGGNFNGLVLANNGVDVPQVWIPTTYSTKATNLPNWIAGLTCGVLRPFRNYLVALDLTSTGVRRPAAFRWSHPADPGTVPVSWDIADPTKDAGEYYLNETPGECTDLISLRGDGIIYKSDAIYRMQEIGGAFIFKFDKISTSIGMPTSRCGAEVKPGMHLFWSGDDVVLFDGQSFQSAIDSKCRRRIQNISDDTFNSAFMVKNTPRQEAWLCWSEDVGNPYKATTALILNWDLGTWGIRDLGAGYNFITTGAIDPLAGLASESWDADTASWESDTSAWGDSNLSRTSARMLGGTASHLTWEDTGNLLNGAAYESYVEKIAFGIPFRQGEPPDISSWKFCNEIWPRVTGDAGTKVQVTIGGMTEIGDNITWGTPQIFTIGTDTKVNCTVSGRLFGIRFSSIGVGNWTLHGYDLNVKFSGNY